MDESKLHLGCGPVYIEGFTHIDVADYPHAVQGSVGSLDYDDTAVDLIYASHVLQYFDREQALNVLREWNRVLKQGGVLRVAVPDFAALAQVYLREPDMGLPRRGDHRGNLALIEGPLYGKQEIVVKGNIGLGVRAIYHRTVYDYRTLAMMLRLSGFCAIHRYDAHLTFPDVDDGSKAYIPHMDFENGVLISLNVEARKR